MSETKIREIFHSVFNKLNNICVVSGLNKKILEEDLNKLSLEELKKRIPQLIDALNRIEDNARSLDKILKEFYESSIKKTNSPTTKEGD